MRNAKFISMVLDKPHTCSYNWVAQSMARLSASIAMFTGEWSIFFQVLRQIVLLFALVIGIEKSFPANRSTIYHVPKRSLSDSRSKLFVDCEHLMPSHLHKKDKRQSADRKILRELLAHTKTGIPDKLLV